METVIVELMIDGNPPLQSLLLLEVELMETSGICIGHSLEFIRSLLLLEVELMETQSAIESTPIMPD